MQETGDWGLETGDSRKQLYFRAVIPLVSICQHFSAFCATPPLSSALTQLPSQGSGAFGNVHFAVVEKLLPTEASTRVAAKMLNEKCTELDKTDFLAEIQVPWRSLR